MRPFYIIRTRDEYGNRWFSWLYAGDPYSEPNKWFETEEAAILDAESN